MYEYYRGIKNGWHNKKDKKFYLPNKQLITNTDNATQHSEDENNYLHVLLINKESTDPLTFDFSFQII